MLRTRGFGKRLNHEDFFANGIRACVKRLRRYLYPPSPSKPRVIAGTFRDATSPRVVPGTSQGILDYPVFTTVSNAFLTISKQFLPFLNNPVWGVVFQHREQTRQNQAQHSGTRKVPELFPRSGNCRAQLWLRRLIRNSWAVFSLCTAQELWGRCPFS